MERFMRPINLYLFTRPSFDDSSVFPAYEQHFSDREKPLQYNKREYATLKRFVNLLVDQNLDLSKLDGFYYSFSIPQIAKEFDLLKISDTHIVNIELKSGQVPEEKNKKQLIQNRHYLSSQGKSILQFAFVSGGQSKDYSYYKLTDEKELELSSLVEIKNALELFSKYYDGQIEELFHAKDFLVSPLDTPDRFLNDQYFLTDQQEEFKRNIIRGIEQKSSQKPYYCQIIGKPGTGKTLLLYDIGKELSKKYRTCIIHCAQVSQNHEKLDGKISNLSIIPIRNFKASELFCPDFDVCILDEAQRIYAEQLETIIKKVDKEKKICILGYDKGQMLSKSEIERDSPTVIANITNINSFTLSNKIRTNPEISDFIKILLDKQEKGDRTKTKKFPNVSVIYANDCGEVNKLIKIFLKHDYRYISYTPSSVNKKGAIYSILQSNANTHAVIGHEFDNVLMVLTNDFQYNEKGRLTAKEHPNPNYLFPKLFYQGITRAREKLAIIVAQNMPLFIQITNIFNTEK